jgi:hypothetical protein
LTAADAEHSAKNVDAFLNQPTVGGIARFSTALALMIILGGDDSAYCEKIEKLSNADLDAARSGLEAAEAKLLQMNRAPSERMKASLAELKRRRTEVFEQNVAKAYKSRPVKLKIPS